MVGTPRLTWRRLAVLCNGLARDPSSLLWRDMAGDMAAWNLNNQLLAAVEHGVRVLSWQNTKDATAKQPKHYPEPIGPRQPGPVTQPPRVTAGALADFQRRTEGR